MDGYEGCSVSSSEDSTGVMFGAADGLVCERGAISEDGRTCFMDGEVRNGSIFGFYNQSVNHQDRVISVSGIFPFLIQNYSSISGTSRIRLALSSLPAPCGSSPSSSLSRFLELNMRSNTRNAAIAETHVDQ